jgi:hypothetical protein
MQRAPTRAVYREKSIGMGLRVKDDVMHLGDRASGPALRSGR